MFKSLFNGKYDIRSKILGGGDISGRLSKIPRSVKGVKNAAYDGGTKTLTITYNLLEVPKDLVQRAQPFPKKMDELERLPKEQIYDETLKLLKVMEEALKKK